MYRRILVPTDGSGLSERASRAAIGFAKRVGARLVARTATPGFGALTANSEILERTRRQYAQSSEERGQHVLDRIADAARAAGVPCTKGLLPGCETQNVLVHGANPALVRR